MSMSMSMITEDESLASICPSSISFDDPPSDYFSAGIERGSVSSRRNSRGQKQMLSKLTVNKLRFHESHLYGRGDELKTLQEAFEKSKESRQLLLLRGKAGTGKSTLSAQIEPTIKRCGGIYVTGKFDYQQQQTPLFGISMACQDLCRAILSLR
jgi:transcriptional regulator of acetoin/glycerol metabolism